MKIFEKNILITGSNRGIGKALAMQAAEEGMLVHLLNRSRDEELEEKLLEKGARSVKYWDMDLNDPENIESFCKKFQEAGEDCDVLINNAGQLTGGLLEEQSIEKIYSMFQANLVGLVHLTRRLLPHMLQRPEARIVNNASVSGFMHLPCASTYAASKAGVVAFTEALRNELEGSNVSTLLMVTPGVKTRMFDEIPDLYSQHLNLSFLDSIPPERWAEKVFECLRKDKNVCWPDGRSYWGVKIGQHWPGLLAQIFKPQFQR